jgi:DNA-binding CsgD family transcriptional regulator
MLSVYSAGYDTENRVFISPAASDHLANRPPARRREFYDSMRERMNLQKSRSVCLIERGEKLVASVISRGTGKSVIGIASIFEFPVPGEEILTEVFGLSPAEARLAQHLARGATLEEFAASRGIKISTARCQLSTLLAKTGTQRQAKLVALLCRLAHLDLETAKKAPLPPEMGVPAVQSTGIESAGL